MRTATVAAMLAVLGLAGCHRGPRPTYEYEPRVTITHTDAPPAANAPAAQAADAPAEPPPATPTTTLPQRPSAWKKAGKF